MRKNRFLASLLSFLVPGLGQIYCGKGKKGAFILAAAIIIGNLNIVFIPLFLLAKPDPALAWAYWIPRLGHDLMSLWSIVFWLWAVVDAFNCA